MMASDALWLLARLACAQDFLVVGSDGLFDVMSNEEVINLVKGFVAKNKRCSPIVYLPLRLYRDVCYVMCADVCCVMRAHVWQTPQDLGDEVQYTPVVGVRWLLTCCRCLPAPWA